MNNEHLAIAKRAIWYAVRFVVSNLAVNRCGFGMIRFEMNRECEWDEPEPLLDYLRIIATGYMIWIVDEFQSVRNRREEEATLPVPLE
jgi:hypothetical protein